MARRGLNLNVSVDLFDNDSVTINVRQATGSLAEVSDGRPETVDELAAMSDVPYDGNAEEVTELVGRIVELLVKGWLVRAESVIAAEMEGKGSNGAVAESMAEVWACDRCEMVNVLDTACARCGKERQAKVIVS